VRRRCKPPLVSSNSIATVFERGQKPVLPKNHAVRPPIGGLLVIAQRRRKGIGDVIDLQIAPAQRLARSQAARCGRPLAAEAFG
jgi:hypothetical protein